MSKLLEGGIDPMFRQQKVVYDNSNTFCDLKKVSSHWIIGTHPTISESPQVIVLAAKSKKPLEITGTALDWHLRLGHCSAEAINHLAASTNGIIVTVRAKAPTTIEYEACAISKATRIVSRRHQLTGAQMLNLKPLERLSFDLIENKVSYNGLKYSTHFKCPKTCYQWIFSHQHKSETLGITKSMIEIAKRQYDADVALLQLDLETSLQKQFRTFTASRGIKVQRSAAYTPSQNGHAERAGRVIITKARTMMAEAGLPQELWPEVY
jgi:hypothetical protein